MTKNIYKIIIFTQTKKEVESVREEEASMMMMEVCVCECDVVFNDH